MRTVATPTPAEIVGALVRRFRPAPQPPAPATVAATETVSRLAQQLPRSLERQPASRRHPVIAALLAAGRPLNQRELAAAIGCSPGHATRLRQQVEHHLVLSRSGRCLYCSLASWVPLAD